MRCAGQAPYRRRPVNSALGRTKEQSTVLIRPLEAADDLHALTVLIHAAYAEHATLWTDLQVLLRSLRLLGSA